MSFSLNDTIEPLTTDEVKKSIYDVASILGVQTTKWKPSSVLRTMIAGTSVVLAALSQVIAGAVRGGYREFAEGVWLRYNAKYVYGVTPLEADFAAGSLLLSNAGGIAYSSVPVGALTVRNPSTNKLYRNTAVFSIGALEQGVSVPIRALEAGSASTSGAGEITALVTAFPGLSCTNPFAIVGTDDESDPDLRTRSGESTGAMSSNGPADAYAFVVRSAKRADGTAIGVNRVQPFCTGDGTLTVVCATPSGAVPVPDLAVLNDEILRKAKPREIGATVVSASPRPVDVTAVAYISNTEASDAAAKAAIKAAIIGCLATTPIGGHNIDSGGKLHRSSIEIAAGGATVGGASLGLVSLDLQTPASDVALAQTDAPAAGAISILVVRVPSVQ